MKLTNEQIKNIIDEYNEYKNNITYTLNNKKLFNQFFTPPVITIKMIEQFNNLSGTILDPCCGTGNLLAAAIKAGADPNKVYGIEIDPDIIKIAKERLLKLGVPSNNIHLGNALDPASYNFN